MHCSEYPVAERDWVVVGARPAETAAAGLSAGRQGLSRSSCIPQTKEEYALARTERKRGHGYTGFAVDCDPSVTLEEDLRRRDLTINAMAQDADGTHHRSLRRPG